MESPAQFEQKATGINSLPDDHSECEPPDPIPNSEVKPLSADGSVGLPHVRVGHRQASKSKRAIPHGVALFYFLGPGDDVLRESRVSHGARRAKQAQLA